MFEVLSIIKNENAAFPRQSFDKFCSKLNISLLYYIVLAADLIGRQMTAEEIWQLTCNFIQSYSDHCG
jgi:hypothetical protein